ncbi:MAG: hypothetical protein ABI947_02755 [Chloroflexota bacterium]
MRFVRNVFVLWVLVFVMVSSVLLYSRTFSEPSELQKLGFGMCSDQPCFMGIVPGVTTWKDAILILKSYDLKEEDYEEISFATVKLKYFDVTVTGSKEDGVTAIQIWHSKIPLGTVIQLMGNPCAVGFLTEYSNHRDPRIFYPFMSADVVLDTDRVTQEAFADPIILRTTRDEALLCKSTPDFPRIKWKGFATLSRYNSNN